MKSILGASSTKTTHFFPINTHQNTLFAIVKEDAKMKKIINGKVYDTASAKLVGEWDNGPPGHSCSF